MSSLSYFYKIQRRNSSTSSRLLFITKLILGLVIMALVIQNERRIVDYSDHFLDISSSSNETEGTSKDNNNLMVQWTLPKDLQNRRKDECENAKHSLTGGFCLTKGKHVGGNHLKSNGLADYLATNVFRGDSVVDLGAGLGHYGILLLNHPTHPVKSWQGFDGAINVQEATNGLVKFMDLTQPGPEDERPCGAVADWVLTLEVAEHIPPPYTDAFLRNIRCRARKGAVISWALPIQTGGLGHVNMKPQEETIRLVERWGFRLDSDLTQGAREAAVELTHFQHSTFVFKL